MATIQQLEQALIKAHQNGNTDHAKRFADEIRKIKAEPQADPTSFGAGVHPSDLTQSEKFDFSPRFVTDPGAREIVRDRLALGFGNEITSGLGAAFSGQPFKEEYARRMAESEDLKATVTDPQLRLQSEVLGAGGAGLGAARLLNPKTWATTAAEGMTLAGAEEYGAADPRVEGARQKAGKTGAAFGLGGSLLGPVAESIGRGAKNTGSAVGRIFSDKGPQPGLVDRLTGTGPSAQQMAKEEAEGLLGQVVRGEEKGFEAAAQRAEKLGSDATVVDALDNEAASVLGHLSRSSRDARRAVEEADIIGRGQRSEAGIIEELKLTPKAGQAAAGQEAMYEQTRKGIQKQMNDLVSGDVGKTPLPNQDELLEFLNREANKDVIRNARKALEARTGRRGSFVDGGGQTNEDLIDVELADYIGDEFSKRVKNIKMGSDVSTSNATAIDLSENWKTLTQKHYPKELTDLKTSYGQVKGMQRAAEEGNKFLTTDLTDLRNWFDAEGRTIAEQQAYRTSTLRKLTDRKTSAVKDLAGRDEELKIVFGDENAAKIKSALEREGRFIEVENLVGPSYRAGAAEMSQDIATGKVSPSEWWEKFRGKRAYSKVGAMGLVGNEVIDVLMTPGVPKAVQAELAKLLASADDVPTFLRTLEHSTASRDLIKKTAEAAKIATRKHRSIQYGILGALNGSNQGDNQ